MRNTITANLKDYPNAKLCTSCIICGASIPLTEYEEATLRYGHHLHSKVCDKCKAAVLYIREQIEQKEN